MSTKQNVSEYIKNLQRYLRVISATEPELPSPPIDGIFDTATEQSLRTYQQLHGLPVTGIADQATWESVYQAYLDALEQQSAAYGFFLFPDTPLNYAVYPDERLFLVNVIQYILNELRVIYDSIPQNNQSGLYDEETRQGVLAFQRANGLAENDRVDRATWNALAKEYRRLFSYTES